MSQSNFIAWVAGCPHVPEDKKHGRKSIETAIRDLESPKGLIPNIAFILGDFSSSQHPVTINNYRKQGLEAASQLCSGEQLKRQQIYCTTGNHDAGNRNYHWYNRYIDDFGNNTEHSGVLNRLRPYPIHGTENSHYKVETGNVVWLVLFDQNDGPNPCGRADEQGGFPSGSVLSSTVEWWQNEVIAAWNSSKNAITLSHYLLKDTTIATGDYEGVTGNFHASVGQPIGSGRLHNIIIDKEANIYKEDQTEFVDFFKKQPEKKLIWFGTHTHYKVGETYNGRGWTYKSNGSLFVNVGSLGVYHANHSPDPQSVTVNLKEGSNIMTIDKFLHSGTDTPMGFLEDYHIEVELNFPFEA
jgi:hypothetical protein